LHEIEILPECVYINVTSNHITSFRGLPERDHLTQLILDNNPIRSFEGCVPLPRLAWLSLRNTPVSRNLYCKLMCLAAFGTTINTINNEKVPLQLKSDAGILQEPLFPHLQAGKVISRLKPLNLVDMKHSGGQAVLCHDRELIDAAAKISGYLAPVDRRLIHTLKEPRHALPRPSTAAILQDFIAKKPRLFKADALPREFVAQFSERTTALREEFTEAEIYYYDEEEEEEEEGDLAEQKDEAE
jgi:hypothetical protein